MKAELYHGNGNKYIVMGPPETPTPPSGDEIQRICHPNFGLGSDGILFGPLPSERALYAVRIFNPDGSEAEKSGNGIRIFSRHLYDKGLVKEEPFAVDTKGGVVKVRVFNDGQMVEVEMGRVSFLKDDIPVKVESDEVLNQEITVNGRTFTFNAATIGNPHCVIFLPEISPELAKEFGPHLEVHPYFPNRTNVQFAQVVDRKNLNVEVWERGAGYTSSSGSSSSAVAAIARRLDLCDSEVTVHMPGGDLSIQVKEDFSVKMTGPVVKISEEVISAEIFRRN